MGRLALFFWLLICFLPGFHAHASEVLLTTSTYEPYVIEQTGEISGLVPDIVCAAFHESNVNVVFRFQPWKRGEEKVASGEFYGTFPYLRTEQRSEKFEFSDPVINFFPKFFYKKSKFPNGLSWQNLKDLNVYVIGGVLGYWYEKSFKDAGLRVQYVTTDQQNIGKLMLGRIDLTLMDELVGWRLIRQAFPEQVDAFAVAGKPESSDAFRLMISRSYPNAKELTETFNAGLQIILKNGKYAEILNEYGVSMEYATLR